MQLQFTEQKYQEECIRNIISIFNDLKEGFGFEYALNQCIKQEKISNSKNIDILMETGTGKTFTYIKTMFELNHNFGYNKFIILVPSLAIREGTKKNFEITKDYFKSIYSNFREREIDVNIYDGSISVINRFLDDDNFSVLVLTLIHLLIKKTN
ncbi:DEAD/DEAH box helicase family protein [Brachyspira hyodysenteriae]|uniref:DEAD/DEAH box helicase family protein n=1 Tax=Brachyspira hyodysenteriae TaxID=159 RepID=UPI0022CDC51B|nr:DEAD/DEAH box helicase family protein [Brachyspira hyodysenteriae]MCZ9887535.1 DEAD/DEAH box helicase family protein [Brachyspira hyodysenteriae]